MKTKLLGIILITAVIGVLASCKEDPDPVCTCTTKLHVGDEPCCGVGGDCETVAGTRIKGIAVTNRESSDNWSTIVTNVTTALNTYSGAKETHIKNTIKEIRITIGGAATPTISGAVLTVTDQTGAGTIKTFLDTYTSGVAMMSYDEVNNGNGYFYLHAYAQKSNIKSVGVKC